MNDINLSSLQRAMQNLTQAMRYAQQAEDGADTGLFETLRGGAIQAFENAYELCVNLTRRMLAEFEMEHMGVAQLSFAELWRVAAACGITDDPKAWMRFRQMRNLTSHTYDEKKAKKVYVQIPEFMAELQHVLMMLEKIKDAASG
jgi:nucleotidyltransferase substrate binding protein (TIGR01987 family)